MVTYEIGQVEEYGLTGPPTIFFWYLNFFQTTVHSTFLPNIIPLYKNAVYPICLLYDQCCPSVLVIFAYI